MIKTLRSRLPVVVLVVLVGCQGARENRPLIPDNWSPSLGQVQNFVEDKLNDTEQVNQQFLVLASQNLADLSDARLFIIYIRLTELLNEQEMADLFNEQQAWLNAREQASSTAVISKGGSLAPLEYNHVFRNMTEKKTFGIVETIKSSQSSLIRLRRKNHEPDRTTKTYLRTSHQCV